MAGNFTINDCHTVEWGFLWPWTTNPFNGPGAWALDDPTLDFSNTLVTIVECERARMGDFERTATFAFEMTNRFNPQASCFEDIRGMLYFYPLNLWINDEEMAVALQAEGFPFKYADITISVDAGTIQEHHASLETGESSMDLRISWEGESSDSMSLPLAILFAPDDQAGYMVIDTGETHTVLTGRQATMETYGTAHATIQENWKSVGVLYWAESTPGRLEWIDDPSCSP